MLHSKGNLHYLKRLYQKPQTGIEHNITVPYRKVEVLLSCMNQENTDIIEKIRITTDVLMINQANRERKKDIHSSDQRIRVIDTRQRGLSRSRNMALKYAQGDICLLCDEDEFLADGYADVIKKAFEKLPDAAVIAFRVENKQTRLQPVVQRVGYLRSLKLASYQLAFRLEPIRKMGIQFDVLMGAGSGNGCGEENKFLWDCLRRRKKIYYVPECIGRVEHGPSTWFFGYNRLFFYQRGAATRYMMGLFLATLYGFYYLAAKIPLYRSEISPILAAGALFRGIHENPIRRQYKEQQT